MVCVSQDGVGIYSLGSLGDCTFWIWGSHWAVIHPVVWSIAVFVIQANKNSYEF